LCPKPWALVAEVFLRKQLPDCRPLWKEGSHSWNDIDLETCPCPCKYTGQIDQEARGNRRKLRATLGGSVRW